MVTSKIREKFKGKLSYFGKNVKLTMFALHSGVFCWSLDHGEKRKKRDVNQKVVDLMI